jgi:hypothetical protein
MGCCLPNLRRLFRYLEILQKVILATLLSSSDAMLLHPLSLFIIVTVFGALQAYSTFPFGGNINGITDYSKDVGNIASILSQTF